MDSFRTHISIPTYLDNLIENEFRLFADFLPKSKAKFIDYIYNFNDANYNTLYFDLIADDGYDIFYEIYNAVELAEHQYDYYSDLSSSFLDSIINPIIKYYKKTHFDTHVKKYNGTTQIYVRNKYDKEILINKLKLYFSNPICIRERVFYDFFYIFLSKRLYNLDDYLSQMQCDENFSKLLIYRCGHTYYSLGPKENKLFTFDYNQYFSRWECYVYNNQLCILYAIIIRNNRNYFVLYSIETKKVFIINPHKFIDDLNNDNIDDYFSIHKNYEISANDINIIHKGIKEFNVNHKNYISINCNINDFKTFYDLYKYFSGFIKIESKNNIYSLSGLKKDIDIFISILKSNKIIEIFK